MNTYTLEHDEQAAVFQWARLQSGAMPELSLLFAIPNGGHRHIAVARKMRAEGVKSGVPDMFLPVARGGYHGLFIEMKKAGARPKRADSQGPVSDYQLRWIAELSAQNYLAKVCYGSAEAIETIQEYLKGK